MRNRMESVQEVTINSYRHMFVLSYMHLLYLLKLPAPPRAALLLGVCIKIPGTCLFPKNVPEKPSKAECRNSKKKKNIRIESTRVVPGHELCRPVPVAIEFEGQTSSSIRIGVFASTKQQS